MLTRPIGTTGMLPIGTRCRDSLCVKPVVISSSELSGNCPDECRPLNLKTTGSSTESTGYEVSRLVLAGWLLQHINRHTISGNVWLANGVAVYISLVQTADGHQMNRRYKRHRGDVAASNCWTAGQWPKVWNAQLSDAVGKPYNTYDMIHKYIHICIYIYIYISYVLGEHVARIAKTMRVIRPLDALRTHEGQRSRCDLRANVFWQLVIHRRQWQHCWPLQRCHRTSDVDLRTCLRTERPHHAHLLRYTVPLNVCMELELPSDRLANIRTEANCSER